jgi:hypothetical protein
MNNEIKKFWEDAGYNLRDLDYEWTRAWNRITGEWFIVYSNHKYYLKNKFTVNEINMNLNCYSETAMLKLIKLKTFW